MQIEEEVSKPRSIAVGRGRLRSGQMVMGLVRGRVGILTEAASGAVVVATVGAAVVVMAIGDAVSGVVAAVMVMIREEVWRSEEEVKTKIGDRTT